MAMNPRLLRPTQSLDADAAVYLAAVEAADGEPLEPAVRKAIDTFFRDLKATSGLFEAIKASCILCGARTLSGALVPLAGDAPTNNNFVTADYDRGSGLKANDVTKYLDASRTNEADPQNDKHIAYYMSEAPASLVDFAGYLGARASATSGGSGFSVRADGRLLDRLNWGGAGTLAAGTAYTLGFVGASRAAAANYTVRLDGASQLREIASQTPASGGFAVFRIELSSGSMASRLAFYSIGESLDLEALDDAVSALVTAIGAAV